MRKHGLVFATCVAVGLALWSGCSKADNPADSQPDTKASISASVSDELTGGKLVLTGENSSDTIAVTGNTIEFPGLEAGSYMLTVVTADGKEYQNTISVEQGADVYLGEIGIISCGEMTVDYGMVYPDDPTYPYLAPQSDFVLWHYPSNGEVVTLWEPGNIIVDTVYPMPMDGSVGSTGIVEPGYPMYQPMVAVTVFFTKPMDRVSIEQSFSITNATDGYFTWENWFVPTDPPVPGGCDYITLDRTAGTMTASGGGYMAEAGTATASSPGAMIMPVWDPPKHVMSMTYYFYPPKDTIYTVSFSTAAKDSGGNTVDSGYTFSFATVTKAIEYPDDPVLPPMPPVPVDCYCTMMFASVPVLVPRPLNFYTFCI
ncbi:MAG: hypothetical protein A2268_05180 [Candidatus Raymondbacteria bacterium RifOxyA12_full_50_37]|nr:MAG: hypothetical protein A2268_05180 [Candidatus Raymondbacteria bacterium RifOxyA12_full_50_37]OGJ88960.1 MAG: hypothetical protein A2248_02415 [Candidatus Raymondbacteria bacterium RIFOXYA2_FULL_49_16]OGJ96988.1 MAG: hypothetical protein A2453_03835 [Candidatus Raymondbacteria bacterium RIFOXYC2_FULL_50_21]OGK02616.1 MAG: hypothetical protein A2350_10235 [Candidatus Raymondbacteria bacterium RifOxyB12_full_50_8]OGP42074.1 MAG: hypothetical protein A2324_18105 [Candidatus Raymondbacteria b